MSLSYCTLTGVDETIPITKLWELSTEFPFVEFGVLYQSTLQGKGGRYPSFTWIERLVAEIIKRPGSNFSLHICGRAVREFIDNSDCHVKQVAREFNRVQLNFRSDGVDLALVDKALARSTQPIIIQHNPANKSLWQRFKHHHNYRSLFDESGGRGLSRSTWPAPLEDIMCGYAGGLGPQNIAEALPQIHNAANGRDYWVDMEGRLRNNDDAFDLDRARICLQIVQNFLANGI